MTDVSDIGTAVGRALASSTPSVVAAPFPPATSARPFPTQPPYPASAPYPTPPPYPAAAPTRHRLRTRRSRPIPLSRDGDLPTELRTGLWRLLLFRCSPCSPCPARTVHAGPGCADRHTRDTRYTRAVRAVRADVVSVIWLERRARKCDRRRAQRGHGWDRQRHR